MILTQIMAPYRIPVFNLLAQDPGLDVNVLFAAESEPHRRWPRYEDEIRFSYEVLPEYLRFRQKTSWTHLSRGLIRRFLRYRPDIVIAGGWDQLSHLSAYVFRHVFHYKFVWWVESTGQDVRPGSRAREAIKRWVVPRADAVLVSGTASRRYAETLGAREVFVAPNAVDNERFRAARSPESKLMPFTFVFVGRLAEEKGIYDLFRAWRMVTDRDLRLVVVGDGPLKGYVERTAARDGSILFRGHKDRDEVALLLGSADALVLPSLSEPWGLVINEAMASGLPIITTTIVGAADDLVRHGENGLVVPPADPAALARAMEEVSASREKAQRMGLRSLELVESHSPEASAAGFRRLVAACVQRS
jgi:glycosyltransferase involved in cell wall biosynthesis